MPVWTTEYDAYCAKHSVEEQTKGSYTAYMVLDYKFLNEIDPPRIFKWHGDPGAILWKAQRLMSVNLGSLKLKPDHLPELMSIRDKLRKLSELQETGDLIWKRLHEAYDEFDPHPRGGPPPASPSKHGGISDLYPSSLQIENTLRKTEVYQQSCGAKRNSTHLGLDEEKKDSLHVPVSSTDHARKRAKPTGRSVTSLQRPLETPRVLPSGRIAGILTNTNCEARWKRCLATSTTEEIVQYWNAICGQRPRTDEDDSMST